VAVFQLRKASSSPNGVDCYRLMQRLRGPGRQSPEPRERGDGISSAPPIWSFPHWVLRDPGPTSNRSYKTGYIGAKIMPSYRALIATGSLEKSAFVQNFLAFKIQLDDVPILFSYIEGDGCSPPSVTGSQASRRKPRVPRAGLSLQWAGRFERGSTPSVRSLFLWAYYRRALPCCQT
jgi:hypothetical protein